MNEYHRVSPRLRTIRTRIFYSTLLILGFGAMVYLLFALRVLILPVLLGIIAAYICQPLLAIMKRNGLPRWGSSLILFGGFLLLLLLLLRYILNMIPGEFEELELRASIQQNINQRYQYYMGLNQDLEDGNLFHDFFGAELDPMMDTLNEWLFLHPADQQKLLQWAESQSDADAEKVHHLMQSIGALRLYTHPKISLSERMEAAEADGIPADTDPGDSEEPSLLLNVINILSIWLIMPVIFLFFLMDRGEFRRGFVSIIPNTYFEMMLTVMENVDRAIGNYLRGTLLETILMTITIWILLVLIGFDIGISLVLALISGIANAIPIFGMFIGIGICVLYALILVDLSPWLPFVTLETLILWVIAVHLLAQAIDNALFKPFVLGKAVDLHPITVFLGAIMGSILFGFIGLLFAIPAIVILKEIIGTLYRQLKAYYIIW